LKKLQTTKSLECTGSHLIKTVVGEEGSMTGIITLLNI
jgi:hypothetical protein